MKHKILKTIPIFHKRKPLFDLSNYAQTISSLRTQLTESQSFITRTSSQHRISSTKIFSYPLTIHTNSFSKHGESLSPLSSSRSCNKIDERHRTHTNLLTFNKRLRLFIREDKNEKIKSALQKIKERNIEEIYYDYDENNQKIKKETFSGNNAGVLKNKILFVKGVMDYMFPRMLMKKMHYLEKKREKDFQTIKTQMLKKETKHNTYISNIQSGNDKVRLSKYNINAVGRGGIINYKELTSKKKLVINHSVVRTYTKKSDLLP